MSYYTVEPEIAGGWGENTVFTRTHGKPLVVHKLHYVFDGWDGDALVESDKCFLATDGLSEEIARARLSGVSFDQVEVTKSDLFDELYQNRQLPNFVWMKVEGTPGRDDFGIAPGIGLVVSARALGLLKRIGFSNAVIAPFGG